MLLDARSFPTLLDAPTEFSRGVSSMTDFERALALLVRAHAPATTSAVPAIDDPSLSLRDDLGFDLIALAELAVAIDDAFDIDLDLADLGACRTEGSPEADCRQERIGRLRLLAAE